MQSIEEIPIELRQLYRTAWEVPMRAVLAGQDACGTLVWIAATPSKEKPLPIAVVSQSYTLC